MKKNVSIFKSTAYNIKNSESNEPCVNIGCSNIDACLKNGLKPGHGIVEVAGESSSGKTQFCLQLALNSQLPLKPDGLRSGTLYIFCEGTFPINRLKDLAYNKYDKSTAKILLENIFIEHIDDVEQLWTLLSSKMLRASLASGRIKTIVIDSITAIIRGEFGSSRRDLSDRSDAFFSFSARMKRYSSLYKCLFVVINQVSAVLNLHDNNNVENNNYNNNNNFGMSTSFVPNGQEISTVHGKNNHVKYLSSNEALTFTPSLGISWSTCVNTRIIIRRLNNEIARFDNNDNESNDKNNNDNNHSPNNNGNSKIIVFQPIVRELRVLLSPTLPFNSFCYFTVKKNGLVNV